LTGKKHEKPAAETYFSHRTRRTRRKPASGDSIRESIRKGGYKEAWVPSLATSVDASKGIKLQRKIDPWGGGG